MTCSKRILWSLMPALVLCLIMGPSRTIQAQQTAATISGLVKDSTDAVIPGVSVSVLHVETGSTRTAVTDDEGRYRVPQLEPGTYEVQAELMGFQTAVRTGIKLAVGDRAVIDLLLNVGEITERVVVEGAAPLVETTETALSGLVDDKKIRDLPLNGRSFEQLALLQTGVTVFRQALTTANVGTGTKFSVAGSRPGQNNFVLDGLTINDSAGFTPGSAAGNNLGVESIREFKVLTNTYSAAYGRNSGGVINVITKSGTNQWHGSVFEFHRNSVLDAKNFFDDTSKDIPTFKRNQFGFSLGGPIYQDKTFIFGNYEGIREGLGLSSVAIVANAASRQGILPDPFNPGQTKTIQVADGVKPFLNFIPLPNGRDFGDGTGEFLSGATRPTDEDYFVIRVDHRFTDSNSFLARYTFDDAEVLTPEPLLIFQDNFSSRNQSAVLEEKTVFSANLINTARFGFNRTFSEGASEAIDQSPPTFIPGQPFGRFRFGQSQSGPAPITTFGTAQERFFPYTTQQYSDDLNWTRGSHGVQTGVSITRIQNNTAIVGRDNTGQFVFNTLENFLTGRPDRFSASTPNSNRARGWRQTHFGFYVQDDFQYSPNLTFNLGFRWEFVTEIREVNGRQSQLVNLSDPAFTVGKPLFNFTGHQLQPRIGIAWDPFGNGKTAIRTGFGIFHDQFLGFFYNLASANLPPFNAAGNVLPPIPFPNAFDFITEGSLVTGVRVVPDADVPMKLHYNLNIQQELSSDTVLTVAYVGSRGTHLPRAFDANGSVPVIRPDGTKFWSRPFLPRKNPNFFLILDTATDANSFYNALQLSLNRRFNNNLQFQFSYNYSHSIDDGSQQLGSEAQNAPQNHTQADNRKADRGHSVFDVRHNFVANATFDLPFGEGQRWGTSASDLAAKFISGWQLNTIVTLADGVPQTLLVGFNNSNNGDILNPERPDLIPGRDNNPVLGGPDQYFDPSSFALPERGTLGDLGRTTIRAPGFANVDVSAVKDTEFAGFGDQPINVQFRAEFFNIFNRPNFGLPDPTLFAPGGIVRGGAGRIRQTVSTSRQIQFSLKILF